MIDFAGRDPVRLHSLEGTPMKRFVRESLTPLLALACAASVFVAAALESPGAARAVAAPEQKAR